MFFASNAQGQRTPLELSGFGGNAAVSNLQAALLDLSRSVGRPNLDPGPMTGMVNGQTMSALQNAMGPLAGKLQQATYAALQNAFSLGPSSAQARIVVAQYAPEIVMAVRQCALQYGRSGQNLRGLGDYTISTPCAVVPVGDPYRNPGNYCTDGVGAFGTFNVAGTCVKASDGTTPCSLVPTAGAATSWYSNPAYILIAVGSALLGYKLFFTKSVKK